MSTQAVWLIVAAIATALLHTIHTRRKRSKLLLPPGPKKLPLIGNLLDVPQLPWEGYAKWSKEFNSDIIHLDVLGTSIVVLSSTEAVGDLFKKRGSLYSHRPHAVMLNELMGWGEWSFGFMDHGDHWRTNRKLFHETFVGAAIQFRPQVRASTHALLRRILLNPQNIMEHLRHMAGSLIISATYGIDVLPSDDPYIHIAEEAMYGLSIACVPGSFLVDSIPLLKYVPSWFPGADFQRKARRWREVTQDLVTLPFVEAKRKIAAGTAPPSFVSLNLTPDTSPEQERRIQETAAVAYAAGSDTTISALGTFVLAMLRNPEAQKRAQLELDGVLGFGIGARLPDFQDRHSGALPYVCALIKEVLRWENVAPISLPHRLTDDADDEYKGYRIPAGSIVLENIWALMHDEELFPDPKSFNPERFLQDGKLKPDIMDPELVVFGSGRRTCSGRQLALDSLWLTIASILATMDIKKAVDEEGKEIEPSYEYVAAVVHSPVPFDCSITPRSAHAVEAIEATAAGD
ncbi:cytochrome P450 [Roridomyces roridus]|uniref:Cytochrome P450 n=1 Tax=Roridomyces roridus TaxID=1738132 RepID=A0AAD7FEZ1_9AGAR|nr:cytochrome P450 [Roridomyces roridus]